MNLEQLTSPTALVILVLVALAFVRFGIWWAIIRVILAPFLRPAGLLIVAAVAVIAVMKLS
ncbi:MAG TPA: hypothetical protein VFJ13_11380 [Paracoccaceae bacterium]|nr:hypothetical protein [Paracoccaceae bacterium]